MKRVVQILLFIQIMGCKSTVSVGEIVTIRVPQRSCDAFAENLPQNFTQQWQLDSVGDLGLRNKYLSLLDSSIVGLPLDCIHKYLGKSNLTFGSEIIYYCGFGKGSSEQLWIRVDNGVISQVSFVLE